MKLFNVVMSACLSVSMIGCATSSQDVSASYVNSSAYSPLSCDELQYEFKRIKFNLEEKTKLVDAKAKQDKTSMTLGMLLFWPSLFFIKGDGAEHSQLGDLKGQYNAINEELIRKKCKAVAYD